MTSEPYYCQHICWERGSKDCLEKKATCWKRREWADMTEKDFQPVTYVPLSNAHRYRNGILRRDELP